MSLFARYAHCPSREMHGISHLLSHHHHGTDNDDDTRSSIPLSSAASDIRSQDTKFLRELLNQKQQQQPDNRLYLHERHVSRGSVSSAYSYGSSSYGSSYGSNSSNHQQSVYHTVHGNIHHPPHHYHHYHQQHYHHRAASTGKASPTSPSPTNEQEKQHHHHHSIQEMIRHFGRRLGHIRRQSESHESPKKRGEDFRNRSQSLDGGARHHPAGSLRESDCETTYRIYESILRQGNASECDRIPRRRARPR